MEAIFAAAASSELAFYQPSPACDESVLYIILLGKTQYAFINIQKFFGFFESKNIITNLEEKINMKSKFIYYIYSYCIIISKGKLRIFFTFI